MEALPLAHGKEASTEDFSPQPLNSQSLCPKPGGTLDPQSLNVCEPKTVRPSQEGDRAFVVRSKFFTGARGSVEGWFSFCLSLRVHVKRLRCGAWFRVQGGGFRVQGFRV